MRKSWLGMKKKSTKSSSCDDMKVHRAHGMNTSHVFEVIINTEAYWHLICCYMLPKKSVDISAGQDRMDLYEHSVSACLLFQIYPKFQTSYNILC